jgi:hypothetical protein
MKIGIRTVKLAGIVAGSFLTIGLACKSDGTGENSAGAGGAGDVAGAGGSDNGGGSGGKGGAGNKGGTGGTGTGGAGGTGTPDAAAGMGGKADAGGMKDGGVVDALTADATPTSTGDAAVEAKPKYDFELNTQLWGDLREQATVVSRSMDQHFAGAWSLKVDLSTLAVGAGVDAGDDQFTRNVGVGGAEALPLSKGAKVTYHIWIPATHGLVSVQPYVMDDAFAWTGTWTAAGSLVAGSWNTLTLELPQTFTKVLELGVEFSTNGPWTGTVYVDAVAW